MNILVEANMGDNIVQDAKTEQIGKLPQQGGMASELYEWAESIVFALAIVVLAFTFVLRTVGVSGPSMMNTLQNGDKVVIFDINYTPRQGDIIVLSTKAVKDAPIIKRVVAVGGQTVNIDYAADKVYVDGKVFNAPIKDPMIPPVSGPLTKLPVKIPAGCVFVMGDNRNISYDSRYSAIGIIQDRDIIGHAVFRIMPFSTFGMLK
jgi:signal peptidase I